MHGKMLARIGAVVFVAVAITATAIEMTRKEEPAERWASSRPNTTPSDPLRDELFRCQALGEAGPRDPACLRAWAENRRRFLAPDARPAERLPNATPAPQPPAETAAPAEPAPVAPPTETR
ncbi:putative entry exclusion protein TrbK-alt [Bradyrhizobium sp. 156]|uniref:putative entry exclusion protein TrbK-alt n=1 Tax=Bradyrhizobium sp. 156 TaxID=2782630 RepID=UPI001FFC2167|nr:putative entry exclusion protein TrbK-alt [Bradyrhizobium sp. 156]MCK1323574.1 putative entry exclusion protein TrbK-alt [Bradyrhizobium sp. 156]